MPAEIELHGAGAAPIELQTVDSMLRVELFPLCQDAVQVEPVVAIRADSGYPGDCPVGISRLRNRCRDLVGEGKCKGSELWLGGDPQATVKCGIAL